MTAAILCNYSGLDLENCLFTCCAILLIFAFYMLFCVLTDAVDGEPIFGDRRLRST